MSAPTADVKDQRQLQFVSFNSFLDSGFWHKLSENKLNVYGLDESERAINGFYFNGDPPGMPCRMNVEFTAFDIDAKTPNRCFPMHGVLHNTNTIDKFKECDKKQIISEAGKKIWEAVVNGEALEKPELLSRFILLTFADLKKYHYYYWFCFPCLSPPTEVTLNQEPGKIREKFTQEQVVNFLHSYDEYQSRQQTYQGYFIVVHSKGEFIVDDMKNLNKYGNTQEAYFGVCDPSTIENYPGWPLRNLLLLISYHWKGDLKNVNILCLRDRSRDGSRDISHSLILSVSLPEMKGITECPKCVGWEKNEKQKLAPRFVNLSASMDPTRLAASAVDLNLKLMRWRLLPELDLDLVSGTKCLLLGAGTLGCNVARCLLGWGVRTITLVDNGRISYSNPVRQSLFVFDDCLKGGKPKAEAAAEALKRIFPGVDAKGLSLSIPMPGHAVPDSAIDGVQKDVQTLQDLVNTHDAIFLLLDTRESRWLPTLMAAEKQKIVICSALGFDTYLVMRHGVKSDFEGGEPASLSSYSSIPGDQLGCYFCNDVVAPGNSLKDRTLDQQCTVSRPGISYMASALAVELLVSVLQHPQKGHASADTSANDDHLSKDFVSALGLVPHQIRCFVSRFQQVLPACRAFDKCTACSKTVIQQYRKDGFDFLRRAFNDPSYLEDLTGLTQMHQETLDAEVWGFSEDEECSSMELS
ncbi:ubiquitin-like modifier-activating enzyme ATG7 [Saccostrea echinata]|uniref:ubiquitin-like modifier-activating enzyme ATG7 n=1 Tax=Saccostrea echinata TaxID=191078 RepID=UPI002A7EC9B2|nr:ubiquitin-like modifier-activating enzyme ATG7 [Saccostrea echinata]